jgi:two-component system chemotaxis response regulator CheB
MSDLFKKVKLFVIGTSAGGVDALGEILPAFEKTGVFCVAAVIHLPADGLNLIPQLLESSCHLPVKEALSGQPLLPDEIIMAPTDYHLCVESNGSYSLSNEGVVNFSRPSIDVLFESAAYAFGDKVVGILLTGASNDGSEGLRKIKELGGVTIVQSPTDAEFEIMPISAIQAHMPDLILKVDEIKKLISELCRKRIKHDRN